MRKNQTEHNLIANPTAPIFLTGFARSGTTWMARALRHYLDVGIVNEGTFITQLGKRYPADKPLTSPDRLVDQIERDDFTRILASAYGISIDWQTIREQRAGAVYADYIQAGLADIAQKRDQRFIGAKSPAFGRQIEALLRHFPDASIIHVVRDGRDCALSHYEKRWGRTNAFVVGAMWRDYIATVRKQTGASRARYLEVFYEDLLREPARYFEQVANFVLALDSEQTDQRQAASVARRFAASVKPGDHNKRAFKWKRAMTEHDVALFDRTAGPLLRSLGYEAQSFDAGVALWRRGYYWTSDKLLREWRHKKTKFGLIWQR